MLCIQTSNLTKKYGSSLAVDGIDLEIKSGQVFGFLGPNGAGKSTLLRVISGLGVPKRGVIRLNGQTITYASPERRAKLGIQQLPGGAGVFSDMTVQQNLIMGAFIHKANKEDVQQRIDNVFQLFPELKNLRKQKAGSLSGGQQQMLSLGRVLLHEPEILLIDELSLGLAPTVVQDLLNIIERLQDKGQTMIVVEQSLNIALSIADRAIFLEKGQVRFEGSAHELSQRDDLARAVFLGDEGG